MVTGRFIALQGEIFLVILGKVQRLGLAGDPLAGVIAEPDALAVHGLDALSGTQDLLIIQLCAADTVAAGGLNGLRPRKPRLS